MDVKALSALDQFTGTTGYYAHGLTRAKLTDGVHYLCNNADCYWLIDRIAYSQIEKPHSDHQDFQVWKLSVNDGQGSLICTDGNDGVLSEHHIDYTDFPLPEIAIWYQGGVLLLPSEY